MSTLSSRRTRPIGTDFVKILSLILLIVPRPVSGQVRVAVSGSTLFEAYDFSPSLGSSVDRVSELSVPLTMTAQLGRLGSLTLGTGYARVSASDGGRETSSISGALDTELRLAFQAVPDRVSVFMTSSFPTGIVSIDQGDLAALGVLASDVIGFSSANLGGGGAVGGGLALSAPAGQMAAAIAASFRASGTYQPVQTAAGGNPDEFRPGGELRLRLGIEGPVARRSFLRVSGILSHRGADQANGAAVPSVGNQFSGYVALDQGWGRHTLSLYVFDLFRSSAGVGDTPIGPSELPRGNVFAGGAQLAILLASGTYLTPRVEIRDSRADTQDPSSGLQRLGRTTRFGLDFRRRIGQGLALVLRADRLTGSVLDALAATNPTDVDVTGYRAAIQLEILP